MSPSLLPTVTEHEVKKNNIFVFTFIRKDSVEIEIRIPSYRKKIKIFEYSGSDFNTTSTNTATQPF
jgi:predicted butyrate kinase (DUF1464 family)